MKSPPYFLKGMHVRALLFMRRDSYKVNINEQNFYETMIGRYDRGEGLKAAHMEHDILLPIARLWG